MSQKPPNEAERLAALQAYEILDTEPEKSFDDLTALASHACEAPIALISLVDSNRQWFKSKVGLDINETERDISFCTHAIQQPQLFVVEDTVKDKRFAQSPLVAGEHKIRFYAAAPVFTSDGKHALGTICVLDRVPRELSSSQEEALLALGRQVQAQLELRLSLNREKQLARIDPLTGVYNRRAFYEVLQRERNRAHRHTRSFTLAYIDLDNFKEVNDNFGHQVGDSVLTTAATVMARNLRLADFVCRLGGDEFAIILPDTGPEAARSVISKVHSKLDLAMKENGLPITFSIGVVVFHQAVLGSAEEMIQKADDLMYFVKGHGKSNVKYEVVDTKDLEPVEAKRAAKT